MCVMSAVMQEWDKIVPKQWEYPTNREYPTNPYGTTPYTPPQTAPLVPGIHVSPTPPVDLENLKAILESFRMAQEAARIADEATGEKDCVDPVKAKLLDRVEALEKIVAELKEAQNQPKVKKKKRKT